MTKARFYVDPVDEPANDDVLSTAMVRMWDIRERLPNGQTRCYQTGYKTRQAARQDVWKLNDLNRKGLISEMGNLITYKSR